jgi:hypothetical protein
VIELGLKQTPEQAQWTHAGTKALLASHPNDNFTTIIIPSVPSVGGGVELFCVKSAGLLACHPSRACD